MTDNEQLIPRFDLKKLMSPAGQGGAAAEEAYHEWNKKHGLNVGHNRLKRKYTGG